MPCSRDKSRVVRNIIYKKFMPILERYRVHMPMECPFHPKRDYLWWPEFEHDAEDDDSYLPWTCPFCGHTFLCAETLAIHWDEQHRPDRNKPEDSVCLADFCDIFRCDVIISKRKKRRLKGKSSKISIDTLIMHPPCNSSELKILEEKCKYVIRQCTVSLLSSFSLKDFQDIEDDLSKSICSYLKCDKFYDDFQEEREVAPLALCLATGILLIGGYIVCYYIIWILFDSNRGISKQLLAQHKLLIKQRENVDSKQLKAVETDKQEEQSQEVRPKIMVTIPSLRYIRPQAVKYHTRKQNNQNQCSKEDDWKSSFDEPTQAATTEISLPSQHSSSRFVQPNKLSQHN